MRIAFDATTLCPHQTGIGYYTEHLLHHLLREQSSSRWMLVSNQPVVTSLPLRGRIESISPKRVMPRSLWMQTVAPRILRSLCPDIVHFTNSVSPLIRTVPTVLTIHDMTLSLLPELHPWRRRLTRPLMWLCAKRADAIITVSESSRRDITRLTGLPLSRVHVIYEAAAPSFKPLRDSHMLDQIRSSYALADRFILHVGTVEPRKNLWRLIQAFARVRGSACFPHQLVLAGPLGWGYREVKSLLDKLKVEDQVRLLDYVPFDDLPGLYNLAEFVVFPSLYEGFGLPVLEAMACGTPVITSCNSSLREIAEGAAEAVDPNSTEAIASAIENLAADEARRADLRERGLLQSRRFSWVQAARKTMEVYRGFAT